jgi:hypothetical protein
MKISIVSISLLLLLACSKDAVTSAENETESVSFTGSLEWVKNYGGTAEETAQSVIITEDGGYAVLGYSNSTDIDLDTKTLAVNDYWLLKLNKQGEVIWNKTYGGSKDDRGQSVIQTLDGGYAITGYSMSDDMDASQNQGFHDNWILKLDNSGNIEWEKSFGYSGHDHSYDLLQTADGGFFVAGFLDITAALADESSNKGSSLTRHGVGEFWGTKVSASGEIEWRNYFGGTNNDRAHAVENAHYGGYILAGFSESDDFDISNTQGSYDFWVVNMNEKGELKWERSFGGSGVDIAYDICKTADGAYVIVGNTNSSDKDVSNNHGVTDVWLIKIDQNGNLLWEKTFGGSEYDGAQSVSLSKDGGFIITGNSKSIDFDVDKNLGENDMWVIKTNEEGAIIWQSTFGGSDLDYAFDGIEDNDNGLIIVGETSSNDLEGVINLGLKDLVILKIK